MRNGFLFIDLFLINGFLFKQKNKEADPKAFSRGYFKKAGLAEGWSISRVGNWEPQWIVTGQPHPVFAKTLLTVNESKNIDININAAKYDYDGKYEKCIYLLEVHAKNPAAVYLNNKTLNKFTSGVVHVKTNYLATPV